MQGITTEGAPRTAGLAFATIVSLALVVFILIKCISWVPALHQKAQSLPKPNLIRLRKRNKSDPPEPSPGV